MSFENPLLSPAPEKSKTETEKRRTETVEFRNAEGGIVKATYTIRDGAKEEAFETWMEYLITKAGMERDWARVNASDVVQTTVGKLENLILKSGDAEIDVWAELQLKEANIFSLPTFGGAAALFETDTIFIPEPKSPVELFILLHENGHRMQFKNIEFMNAATKNNTEAILEIDANQRAFAIMIDWKNRGIDLTKPYAISGKIEEYLNGDKSEKTDVFRKVGAVTMEQIANHQMHCRGITPE